MYMKSSSVRVCCVCRPRFTVVDCSTEGNFSNRIYSMLKNGRYKFNHLFICILIFRKIRRVSHLRLRMFSVNNTWAGTVQSV